MPTQDLPQALFPRINGAEKHDCGACPGMSGYDCYPGREDEGPECTSSRLSSIIGDKHEKQAFISNYTQLVCKQTRAISNGSISG